VAADLTTPDGVQTAVDFALDSFGSLDILVNNAGGIPYDTPGFPHRDPQDWSMVLDLNLRVPLLAIQLALPSLAARNGTVVNIGSTAGLDDEPCHSPEYSAAKAGLIRPPPVSLDALYDAVANLIEDEEARGKVVELR
jgi:NAD(P)-dependent dehydrogenase (short-subunit alcohol dehydrogenase family)